MAKLGIALGSGPRDLGFESRHSDQRNRNPLSRVPAFAWVKGGFEQSNGAVRWPAPCRRLDGGNTMILIPKGIRMQRIPTLRPQNAPAAAGAFFIPCTLRLRMRLHAYTLYTRVFGSAHNAIDRSRHRILCLLSFGPLDHDGSDNWPLAGRQCALASLFEGGG